MIDPFNITNFNRSEEELQIFLLFSLSVAGKTAVIISKAVDNFLKMGKEKYGYDLPFNLIAKMKKDGKLRHFIKKSKLGKHNVLTKGFGQLINLNVKTATIEQLEEVCGISFKTSRFYILHSRPNQEFYPLDVHALHYLRDCGVDAPATTPSSKKKYMELEKALIQKAKDAKMSIADFDLSIWKKYTKTKPMESKNV